MSEMKYVVSAVAYLPLNGNDEHLFERLWKEYILPIENVENYHIEDDFDEGENRFRFAVAKWKGFLIEMNYHSGKKDSEYGDYVIEITIADDEYNLDIFKPDDVVKEINKQFYPLDFHLEVYSWYTGTDRTGATPMELLK